MALWIFLNTGPYGAGNFKTLLLQQFLSDPIQTLLGYCLPWENAGCYSSSWQSANLWHFEILTWESMEKPKMWNISKTGDPRVKRMKFWDSEYYSAHMQGTFDAWFFEICLGPFHSEFSKHGCTPNFHSISSKLYTRYPNHGATQAITFWRSAKSYKKDGILKFFLSQEHRQLEISKCYFSHNFHWNPCKLYEDIGYHGKSKCLLEYWNEKFSI